MYIEWVKQTLYYAHLCWQILIQDMDITRNKHNMKCVYCAYCLYRVTPACNIHRHIDTFCVTIRTGTSPMRMAWSRLRPNQPAPRDASSAPRPLQGGEPSEPGGQRLTVDHKIITENYLGKRPQTLGGIGSQFTKYKQQQLLNSNRKGQTLSQRKRLKVRVQNN